MSEIEYVNEAIKRMQKRFPDLDVERDKVLLLNFILRDVWNAMVTIEPIRTDSYYKQFSDNPYHPKEVCEIYKGLLKRKIGIEEAKKRLKEVYEKLKKGGKALGFTENRYGFFEKQSEK